ncbi:MAG: hypothetical protein CMI13_10245 [Oleibacter sp.]|nr:hypothetical protein [Thalassolituus sp.]|tara:strand:- start:72 stop:263 length:192 start_codon:yes stop_codon:yes gene_type:complete
MVAINRLWRKKAGFIQEVSIQFMQQFVVWNRKQKTRCLNSVSRHEDSAFVVRFFEDENNQCLL